MKLLDYVGEQVKHLAIYHLQVDKAGKLTALASLKLTFRAWAPRQSYEALTDEGA